MTIGQASERTHLPESTLRYYEKNQLIRVSRLENGHRNYAEEDIAWIQFIRRLKETGMPLRDIRRYSALRYSGNGTLPERLEMLELHRAYVLDQREKWAQYLQNLEDKIALYRKMLEDRNA